MLKKYYEVKSDYNGYEDKTPYDSYTKNKILKNMLIYYNYRIIKSPIKF